MCHDCIRAELISQHNSSNSAFRIEKCRMQLHRFSAPVAVLTFIMSVFVGVPVFSSSIEARVAIGCNHYCVLESSSQTIFCWGDNSFAQCGHSPAEMPHIADFITSKLAGGHKLTSPAGIKGLELGCTHSCVVFDDDSVECWGYVSSQASSFKALDVALRNGGPNCSPTFGDFHACQPAKGNTLECIGSHESALGGISQACGVQTRLPSPSASLSASATTTRSSSETPSTTPTVTGSSNGTLTTSASQSITASYTSSRSGTASTTSTASRSSTRTPTPSGSPLPLCSTEVKNISIAAGEAHTCAVVNGNLTCWGQNSYGQLGNNKTTKLLATEINSYLPLPLGDFQTALGYDHTCVWYSSGSGICWGENSDGQLGYGHTASIPPLAAGWLPGGDSITRMAAGWLHTCALYTNGAVKCWGGNGMGQLGYNHTNRVLSIDAAPYVPLGGQVQGIAAGLQHTCALYVNGSVKCWGYNVFGQLGYGDNANVFTPAAVDFLPTRGVVQKLSLGDYHTCVLYTNGSALCWGWNNAYQLGYGLSGDVLSPRDTGLVQTDGTLSDTVAGGRHTCALYINGSVKCWGGNSDGQVGFNRVGGVHSPAVSIFLPLGAAVKQLVAGQTHTCALLVSNGVKCWGRNTQGQLGTNDTVSITSPVYSRFVPLSLCG